MHDVVLLNSLYEIGAWCTSIVAQAADGTILHSRNLDYDYGDIMRAMTFNAKFRNGKEELFDAVMFGGLPGVYTGMRPNGFSIS